MHGDTSSSASIAQSRPLREHCCFILSSLCSSYPCFPSFREAVQGLGRGVKPCVDADGPLVTEAHPNRSTVSCVCDAPPTEYSEGYSGSQHCGSQHARKASKHTHSRSAPVASTSLGFAVYTFEFGMKD